MLRRHIIVGDIVLEMYNLKSDVLIPKWLCGGHLVINRIADIYSKLRQADRQESMQFKIAAA